MNIFEAMETSPALEKEGVELTMFSERLTLARSGGANTDYVKALEKVARERRATLNYMSNDEGLSIAHQLFATHIVKKWETNAHSKDGSFVEGIANPSGKEPLPVTRENIIMMFKRIPDLFAQAQVISSEGSNFRRSHIEAVQGN